jgi:outer membrane protein assembly factor BamB
VRGLKNGLPVILLVLGFAMSGCKSQAKLPEYYAPLKNADYVSKDATIAVRYGPNLSKDILSKLSYIVLGTESGLHSGTSILADDGKTVIFKPDHPFSPGEKVKVDVNALRLDSGEVYIGLSYTFRISQHQESGTVTSLTPDPADDKPRSAFPGFLTVPQDIPHFRVTTPDADSSEGDIFVSPFYWTKNTTGSYLLILDAQGRLVYYKSMAEDLGAFDFKLQPNGMLSYYDQLTSNYVLMNSSYQVVDTYQAGNGYVADLHDFLLLPDGNALLMAYDAQSIDMSKIVQGGKPDALVTGLIIQELDPSKNVIFEWRSWDHFSMFDSTSDLTADKVDLVHGNALAVANDGNLLLSSRNQSEITKINLHTGEVMWRWGGKAGMFQFVDGAPFAFQHDVRQLLNGDITVFDNQGSPDNPAPSHGLIYRVDPVSKTARQIWSYTHEPEVFATFMGNTQVLPDGNVFLSWGSPSTKDPYAYVSMTEVSPQGQTLFEMSFDKPYVSYRAFRFPWQAAPATKPDLAYMAHADQLTLGYSWNGATDVAGYRVFGGQAPDELNELQTVDNSDFEMQSKFSGLPSGECYFQVAALDSNGAEKGRSKLISTDARLCPLGQ